MPMGLQSVVLNQPALLHTSRLTKVKHHIAYNRTSLPTLSLEASHHGGFCSGLLSKHFFGGSYIAIND
ncbi:hypothetical protein BCR42DRAFT_433418 [Absidia repens]|uniref:Uncharacterized protein n=1 Tax=Absidia repens TaxID=90262 RepID=A0A1X2ITG1_9FUNG|nr:hypothetical protein BCR42DRAFT_433418 [Absidia repens]